MNEHSEQIHEIAVALCAAQSEMQAAAKSSENQQFRSRYANLTSIVETSRPALTKNDLAVTQTFRTEEGTIILDTWLIHKSGQFFRSEIGVEVPASEKQPRMQVMGSIISYIRRYAYAAITGMVTDDDDDGNTAIGNPASSHKTTSSTEMLRAKQTETKPTDPKYAAVQELKSHPNWPAAVSFKDPTVLYPYFSGMTGRQIKNYAELTIEDIHNVKARLDAQKPDDDYDPFEEGDAK